MGQTIKANIPNEHYDWLEKVRKRRGLDSIQEALRRLIEELFLQDSSRDSKEEKS